MPATPVSASAETVAPLSPRPAPAPEARGAPRNGSVEGSQQLDPTGPYLTPALQAVARARERTARIHAARQQLDGQMAKKPRLVVGSDRKVVPTEPAEVAVVAPPPPWGLSVDEATRASVVRFQPRRARPTAAGYWTEYRPTGLVSALSIAAASTNLPSASAEPVLGSQAASAPVPVEVDEPPISNLKLRRAQHRALVDSPLPSGPAPATTPLMEAATPWTSARATSRAGSATPTVGPQGRSEGPFGRHVPLPTVPPQLMSHPDGTRQEPPRITPPWQGAVAPPARPGDDDQSELVLSDVVEPAPIVPAVTPTSERKVDASPVAPRIEPELLPVTPPPTPIRPPARIEATSLPTAPPSRPSPPPSSPRRFSKTIAAAEEVRSTVGSDGELWSYMVPGSATQSAADDSGLRRWLPWPRRKGSGD
jgi:hypothetical protein